MKETSGSDTKSKIIDAAAAAFGEEGFAGARVDDIAVRAGVNKATVYYHVGGKETLYAAVVGRALDTALASLQESLNISEDPAERFRIVVRTLARTAAIYPHFAPLMLREVASGGSALPDEILEKMARLLGFVAEVLAFGAETGEFREVDPIVTHMSVAGATLFLMAGTPLRQRMRKIVGKGKAAVAEHRPEDLPEIVASLILDGLRGSPKATPAASKRGKGRKS